MSPATADRSPPPGTISSPPRSGRRLAVSALVVACCATGVLLRFWPRPAIWLDEAQSLAFASAPLNAIPGALRQDGAPPLYYVLLHGWMWLVGDGDDAVRLLSSLLSAATLVVLAIPVRRRWGTALAAVATVLLATNPFAIRYATHARLFSLVMLEVVVALALVARALERPRAGRLAAVTLVAAAMLYTHYWTIYLLATAAALLWLAGRHGDATTRRSRRLVAISAAAEFVLWLPWVPTFVFQARHTATPWAPPASAASALEALIPTVEGPLVGRGADRHRARRVLPDRAAGAGSTPAPRDRVGRRDRCHHGLRRRRRGDRVGERRQRALLRRRGPAHRARCRGRRRPPSAGRHLVVARCSRWAACGSLAGRSWRRGRRLTWSRRGSWPVPVPATSS